MCTYALVICVCVCVYVCARARAQSAHAHVYFWSPNNRHFFRRVAPRLQKAGQSGLMEASRRISDTDNYRFIAHTSPSRLGLLLGAAQIKLDSQGPTHTAYLGILIRATYR